MAASPSTVESVGSSTWIESAKLTNREVDLLLSNLDLGSFKNRDEQEVPGYAEATNLVFDSWREVPHTEGHIRQLHGVSGKPGVVHLHSSVHRRFGTISFLPVSPSVHQTVK